jgi:hypothetical protein
MPIRFVFLLGYLAYALSSGSLSKQGSGADPMGHNPPSPPATPTLDQGSGADPWG